MNVIQNDVTRKFKELLFRQKAKRAEYFTLHDTRSVGLCSGTAKYRIDCVYRLRGIVEMGRGRNAHKQLWRVGDLEQAMKGWDE